MKKILYGLLIAAISFTAASVPTGTVHAQSTGHLVSKTITGVDTITFSQVPSKIKSFNYTLLKTSGTVAGYVILQGGTISGEWYAIDTLTLANSSSLQTKRVLLTSTSYLNYRWINTNSSAAVAAVKSTYLRRTDE